MTLEKGIKRKWAATSAVLAFGVSLSASAQFGGPATQAYTPEPDARDLKSVLFNWPWHMGMLRGIEEHELIVTLEYRAEGTIQVDGQPCTVTPFEDTERHGELGTSGYRVSSAYQFAGSRTQIECTLNGIGERAGNTSLEECAMALYTRRDHYQTDIGINTRELYRMSRLVARHTGMTVAPNKAIVGENAFAHEAGIHQDGVLKHKDTYEIMNAELVGRDAGVLVMGKHSGRNAFRKTLADLGYEEMPADTVNTLFRQFKDLCDRKSFVTTDDILALVGSEVSRVPATYTLESVQFQSGTGLIPVATVRLITDTGTYNEAATGDGPVDAVYRALERISQVPITLDSYEIRSVGSGKDALGEVSIRAESEGRFVTGRGLSTDVLEASAHAYVDVLNKLAAGVVRSPEKVAAP